MNKSFLAKSLGWLGGSITALGLDGKFGKYSAIASLLGPFLTSVAVHLASQTGPVPAKQ